LLVLISLLFDVLAKGVHKGIGRLCSKGRTELAIKCSVWDPRQISKRYTYIDLLLY